MPQQRLIVIRLEELRQQGDHWHDLRIIDDECEDGQLTALANTLFDLLVHRRRKHKATRDDDAARIEATRNRRNVWRWLKQRQKRKSPEESIKYIHYVQYVHQTYSTHIKRTRKHHVQD